MTKEKVLLCPYCPCQFSSHYDLWGHLEEFGYDAEKHLAKFQNQKYRRDF